MKKNLKILLLSLFVLLNHRSFAQYNRLWIPDTLSGTQFTLKMKDTLAQILPGQQTLTEGINGKFWGPTMFFNKGDTVHMHVYNNLNDSTTLHWHGFHLPPVMDGGPHQVVPPKTIWEPYWQVKNRAATYWYHPHLHMTTEEQLNKTLGGLIIVRDSIEAALALPRKYGIDDIPLILTDRRFDTQNQLVLSHYGDTMFTNFTLNAQYTVPAQVVRFRILTASAERTYNLKFSDGRTFYVISSDAGLLKAPVALSSYKMHPGERIEILVNFSGQINQSVNLMAYNNALDSGEPGSEPNSSQTNAQLRNALGNRIFSICRFNVGLQTSNPITKIPTTLTTVTTIDPATATVTRSLTFTAAGNNCPPNAFGCGWINSKFYNYDRIDYRVKQGTTEIWELKNNSSIGHPFHIHDVSFNIINSSYGGGSWGGSSSTSLPATMAGWKDVVYVPAWQTMKFVAKFEDNCDSIHPFMYHCHILYHEDAGMMGQFTVGNCFVAGGDTTNIIAQRKNKSGSIKTGGVALPEFTIYPNPAHEKISISLKDPSLGVYYVTLKDAVGRTIYMLPGYRVENAIDISFLSPGIYYVILQDDKNKKVNTKKFIVK